MSNRNSFRVLFERLHLYSSTGNGQPREPALCQLYRHTFVPYFVALFARLFSGADVLFYSLFSLIGCCYLFGEESQSRPSCFLLYI